MNSFVIYIVYLCSGIEAAWAGGEDGREVIDKLLPLVASLLSPKGVFYMVVVEENKPHDIAEILAKDGLKTVRITTRRAKNELLSILKIIR